jgi:HNH endonuclease
MEASRQAQASPGPVLSIAAVEAVRAACLARDRYQCTMADCPTPDRGRRGVLIADHIEPRREGGPDELWNLRTLCSLCDSRRHYSLFFANARPEADLRYFSKSNARFSSEKARYVFTRHGLNFEVCDTSPELCFFNRARKSRAIPV